MNYSAGRGGFAYRMTDARDVACLLYGTGFILREHGSLGACFARHYRSRGSVRGALGGFVDEPARARLPADHRQARPDAQAQTLSPHPDRQRLQAVNLFLRWMVRGPDGVDFGLWRSAIPAAELIVPLDTHVHRIGRFIGLTRRKDLLADRRGRHAAAAGARSGRSGPLRLRPFPPRHQRHLRGAEGRAPLRRLPAQAICTHWV